MKVLLAIDGSSHARFAENLLSQIPFAEPPEVVIASVCPVPDLHYLGHEIPASINLVVDQSRDRARQQLDEASSRCAAWAKSVETQLLDGSPGRELVHAAEQSGADLIVVGARGIGAPHRFLLGSVSDRVVKYAPCSVLVAHSPDPAQPPRLKHILIADDGSPPANAAVARFAGLPLGDERYVQVVQVLETFKTFGFELALQASEEWKQLIDQAHARLNDDARQLTRATPHVATSVQQATSVADEILDTARHKEIDLIVVGSTGRSAWERMLLGSVTSRIIHHTPCSVWIERPRRGASN